MKVIRGKDIKAKNWGGGKTSELFIFPEQSSYANRQFNFRLSKATIEIRHSSFTKLPEVKRELMVLKGELNLIHQNKYNKYLQPFQSDRFNGGWQTESIGLAEDFNLMMLGNTEGYLEHVSSSSNGPKMIKPDCDIVAIYCALGAVKLNAEVLHAEDLGIISPASNEIDLSLSEKTELIIVRIWLNN